MLLIRAVAIGLSVFAPVNGQLFPNVTSGAGNQASQDPNISGPSIACQAAIDSIIAGTALTHFLIVTALGAAPPSIAEVGDNLTQALQLVSQASRYIGNLALGVATYSAPKTDDITGLNRAVQAILAAVTTAQKDALANMDNVGNGTINPIAIFTPNGPEIVPATQFMTANARVLNIMLQTNLQLQWLSQSLAIGQSCANEPNNSPNATASATVTTSISSAVSYVSPTASLSYVSPVLSGGTGNSAPYTTPAATLSSAPAVISLVLSSSSAINSTAPFPIPQNGTSVSVNSTLPLLNVTASITAPILIPASSPILTPLPSLPPYGQSGSPASVPAYTQPAAATTIGVETVIVAGPSDGSEPTLPVYTSLPSAASSSSVLLEPAAPSDAGSVPTYAWPPAAAASSSVLLEPVPSPSDSVPSVSVVLSAAPTYASPSPAYSSSVLLVPVPSASGAAPSLSLAPTAAPTYASPSPAYPSSVLLSPLPSASASSSVLLPPVPSASASAAISASASVLPAVSYVAPPVASASASAVPPTAPSSSVAAPKPTTVAPKVPEPNLSLLFEEFVKWIEKFEPEFVRIPSKKAAEPATPRRNSAKFKVPVW